MQSVYLDDLQIHSLTSEIGFALTEQIVGLESPAIRLPTFERPNSDGAFVPNHLYGGRLISLKGVVYGDSQAVYRARRRSLEAAVSIKRYSGILMPRLLKFTTMDDLELQVSVYTRKFELPDEHLDIGNFRLDLFAPDFYLYSQEEHHQDINIFSGGGMAIPMGIPMDMSVASTILEFVVNAGNADAYPRLRFYGPIEDPVVTNVTTGEQLSVDYTVADGDYLEVDTSLRTAKHVSGGTETNVLQYVTGDFFRLVPGSNTLKLDVATIDDGFLSLWWRDSYLGV